MTPIKIKIITEEPLLLCVLFEQFICIIWKISTGIFLVIYSGNTCESYDGKEHGICPGDFLLVAHSRTVELVDVLVL